MTVAARDVAAILRERVPGLPTKKLHKLLYYCQGHHLATFDEPLFDETISAWDMGPVVGTLWYDEKQGDVASVHAGLTEAQLNTVGYVLSRYGALTGLDLENLTHSEAPWRRADRNREPGASVRIEPQWMRDYFRTIAVDDDAEEPSLDPAVIARWLQGAPDRHDEPARPDSPENLRNRLTAGA